MTNIEKLDDELYTAAYIESSQEKYTKIWNQIKSNPAILKEAVEVVRDRFDERDIVKGLAISEAMLMEYDSVDQEAYANLIHSIYTNVDIARIVINGAANGGCSFLLISLWNPNLKLTEEQKSFAVSEAMNKVGTMQWYQNQKVFYGEIDAAGISDSSNTLINIDGCMNVIGQKSYLEYRNYMFSLLTNDQAHGIGAFDIRYWILKNSNWSLEEKQQLIMDFWYDPEEYDECLESWEWTLMTCYSNNEDVELLFEENDLYEINYEMLLSVYGSQAIADKVWNEIQFCKQMHELRPHQLDELKTIGQFTPKKGV